MMNDKCQICGPMFIGRCPHGNDKPAAIRVCELRDAECQTQELCNKRFAEGLGCPHDEDLYITNNVFVNTSTAASEAMTPERAGRDLSVIQGLLYAAAENRHDGFSEAETKLFAEAAEAAPKIAGLVDYLAQAENLQAQRISELQRKLDDTTTEFLAVVAGRDERIEAAALLLAEIERLDRIESEGDHE